MIANFILGLSIALLPLFIRLPAYDWNRQSKDLLFVTIVLTITLFLNKIKRRIPYTFIFASIYILSNITFNQRYPNSNDDILYNIEITAGLVLFIKYYLSHDKKSFHYILDGMVVGSLIQSVLAISGYFGFELYGKTIMIFKTIKIKSTVSGANNAGGSLGNPNLLGSYLAICLPAFFSRKKYLKFIILPIIALILGQSLMGILASTAGLIYYLNYKFKIISKFKLYLITIVSMIILPFFNIGIDNGRFEIWSRIINGASLKECLIGMGPGGFSDWAMVIKTGSVFRRIVQEHNSYLTIFNVIGIFGILLILPLFTRFITTKDKDPLIASIVYIIFCNSWGHFTIQQSTVMIIIIPMIAYSLTDEDNVC